jgi:predicted secreted protein
MKISSAIFLTLLFLCSIANTANLRTNRVYHRDDLEGTTIAVHKGDSFKVKLDGNAATGYGWKLDDHNNRMLDINLAGHRFGDYVAFGGRRTGGEFVFKFDAEKRGESDLVFHYARHRSDEIDDEIKTKVIVN